MIDLIMDVVGWSGQLEGTLGTDSRTVEQMERPTPALSCAFQAYSTWFPTSWVASRIGVGSGLDRPIASQGHPTFFEVNTDDFHLQLLDSTHPEVLSI